MTRFLPALLLLAGVVVACSPAPAEQEQPPREKSRPAATTPTASSIHVVQVDAPAPAVGRAEARVAEPRLRKISRLKRSTQKAKKARVQTARVQVAVEPHRTHPAGGAGIEIVQPRPEFAYWEGCRMANALSLMQYCNP